LAETVSSNRPQFAAFLSGVDDELDRLLERAHDKFIAPLAGFRKEQVLILPKVTNKAMNYQILPNPTKSYKYGLDTTSSFETQKMYLVSLPCIQM
jgi:hypothetical protein